MVTRFKSSDTRLCSRCGLSSSGRIRDEGYGDDEEPCICPRENPHTPPSPSAPVTITAEDWLALNAKRMAREAKAEEAKRQAEAVKTMQAAEILVKAFMQQINDGLNPWKEQKSYQLPGEPIDLRIAQSFECRLSLLGFDVAIVRSNTKIATPTAALPDYLLYHVIVCKPVPK